MELRAYFAILRRRKWSIVATLLAALAAAAASVLVVGPRYEATATLRVTPAGDTVDRVSFDAVMYAGRVVNTYAKLATTDSVRTELGMRLGVATPPSLRVEVPANTELMQIIVADQDPAMAAQAANVLSDILIERIRQLSDQNAESARELLAERLSQLESELASSTTPAIADLKREQFRRVLEQYERLGTAEATRSSIVTVVESATLPVARSVWYGIGIAAVLGIVGGVGFAFLADHLDTRLHTMSRIAEVSNLPILGAIPTRRSRRRKATERLFPKDSPQYEAIRHIRTLLLSDDAATPRSLAVTSTGPNEGTSTLVANLALALTDAGRHVIVLDCNFRRPALHTIFDLRNSEGLSTILTEDVPWSLVAQHPSGSRLRVVTSGPIPPDVSELLEGGRLAGLLEELATSFDLILLDAPSMLAASEAEVLARIADGVILVVEQGRVREQSLQTACADFSMTGASPVGVVVSHADRDWRQNVVSQAAKTISGSHRRGGRRTETRRPLALS
jgi:capsular exopolysaccharide synthesis family protein